ncbi:MAG: hypothetical protein VCB06_08505, partial [Alphaproteobacteria bacterium]
RRKSLSHRIHPKLTVNFEHTNESAGQISVEFYRSGIGPQLKARFAPCTATKFGESGNFCPLIISIFPLISNFGSPLKEPY